MANVLYAGSALIAPACIEAPRQPGRSVPAIIRMRLNVATFHHDVT
jgi:hypothetical protein